MSGVSTEVSCCQEAMEKKGNIRAAGLRRSNSNWEPTASEPSRTVIRHNTDKEDIKGRNTN